jgi:hypothetical protein
MLSLQALLSLLCVCVCAMFPVAVVFAVSAACTVCAPFSAFTMFVVLGFGHLLHCVLLRVSFFSVFRLVFVLLCSGPPGFVLSFCSLERFLP